MRPRDADNTRRILLETAERLFVRHGFEGTRVDDIAAGANVNKRMIYAYFQNKEGLYREVLRRNFARALALVDTPMSTADPGDQVEIYIREYFRFLAENETYVRLFHWEALAGGKEAAAILQEFAAPALDRLHGLIREGMHQGRFRPDLEARRVVLSIHNIALSFFAQRGLLELLWKEDLSSPASQQAFLDHTLRFVFDGVRAPSEPTR